MDLVYTVYHQLIMLKNNYLLNIIYYLYKKELYVDKGLVSSVQHLHASFEEESGFLQFATSMTSNDPEEIHKFLDKATDARSLFNLLFDFKFIWIGTS